MYSTTYTKDQIEKMQKALYLVLPDMSDRHPALEINQGIRSEDEPKRA
jgi:hypothetical protein